MANRKDGKPRNKPELPYKRSWSPAQTREHTAYMMSALSEPHSLGDVLRAAVQHFCVHTPGVNDRQFDLTQTPPVARNPISRRRAALIMERVLDEMKSMCNREIAVERNAARAIHWAHRLLNTAVNGRIVTIGRGTENPRTIVQKPSIHGAVLVMDHLAKLTGTYMPEKTETNINQSTAPEDIVIRTMYTRHTDKEIREEMAAMAERYCMGCGMPKGEHADDCPKK